VEAPRLPQLSDDAVPIVQEMHETEEIKPIPAVPVISDNSQSHTDTEQHHTADNVTTDW